MKQKHIFSLIFSLIAAVCAFGSGFGIAAPSLPQLYTDTLSLIQAGDFPLAAPETAKKADGTIGTAFFSLFRSTDLSGAREAVRTGLLGMSEQIPLRAYQLSTDQLKTVLQDLINDCPELFHVKKQYQFYADGTIVDSLVPAYNCTPSEYEQRRAAYDAEIARMLALRNPSWSEAETVLFYHDYLALRMTYDTTEPLNFDAYSFLTEKTGVCQAYTLTFTALMDRIGIECSYAQSEAMVHIWNLVKLDGEWYHVDITWDDPTPNRDGQVLHNLLLRSDEGIREVDHHSWITPSGIACTDTRFENAAWKSSTAPIVNLNGVWYSFDRTSGALSTIDPQTGLTGASVTSITEKWPTPGGEIYVNRFSGLAASGNLLYFNTPTEIFAFDPITGVRTSVKVLPEGSGYLYGLWENGGQLSYATASDYAAPSICQTIDFPLIPTPDYGKQVHLYRGELFVASFDTVSAAVSSMNDRNADYTIALYPRHADTAIPFNTLSIPGGIARTIKICPLRGSDPITLGLSTTAVLGCDMLLENITLVSTAISSQIQLGSHSLSLSGTCAVGTDAAPIHIDGDGYSALSINAGHSAASLHGNCRVGTLDLRGEAILQGQVQTTTVRVLSAASLYFPQNGASFTAVDAIGSNELTLIPTASASPAIEIGGITDIILRYHYPLSYASAPLLTAPNLPYEELAVLCETDGRLIEVTPLFEKDESGVLSRKQTSMPIIHGTTLVAYVSMIPNDRVSLPSELTEIASYAFAGCPNVKSVLIPPSVQVLHPFSVGYTLADGQPVPIPDFTISAEENSPAAQYAAESGLDHLLYRMEESDDFVYRFYPSLSLAELIEWKGEGSRLLIPASIPAYDGTVCSTSIAADLAAGKSGLTIFSPFAASSSLNPYASAWSASHTHYPSGTWHILTLMLEDTVLRAIPLPAAASPANELIIPSYPAAPGETWRFVGWDVNGDALPDPIPDRLDADLTLHALFQQLSDQVLISWYNDDGTLFCDQALERGTVIQPPAPPLKSSTISHTYLFDRWEGFTEGMTADASLSFTAVFRASARKYECIFRMDDGSLLSDFTADYGTPILPPASPTKPNDENYRYIFSHWEGYEKNMVLTADTVFTAVFIAVDLSTLHPSDITSSVYPIAFGLLTNIAPGTSASALLASIDQTPHLLLCAKDGTPIDPDRAVATGMTLSLLDKDGVTVLKTLTLAVIGDISGDGSVTITDFLRIKSHLLGVGLLSGAQADAADLNGDDTVSLTDFIRMRAILLGIAAPNE